MALSIFGVSTTTGAALNPKQKVITLSKIAETDVGGAINVESSALYGYTPELALKAQEYLGISTELIQEEIRNELHTTNYQTYLEKKQKFLNGARSEAISAWAVKYNKSRALGLDEDEAKKRASDYAKVVYKMAMEEFKVLYPSDGNKVKETY
jgi:hypothetical protein